MMLRKGQTFTLNGQRWKIAYINPSRAHCVNVTKHTVEIVDKRTGQTRRFTTTGYGAIDISPNTDLTVLAELEGGTRGH